jgi:hypothetical protein
VPMILFILPTLFIVLMGPAALGIIDTFDRSGSGGPKHVTVVTHKNNSGDDLGAGGQQPEITEKQADDEPAADQAPDANSVPVTLTLAQPLAAAGEPIVVDVEARALAENSNLRVVVVPLETPETIADEQTFFADAKDVAATQMQVTVTARSVGKSEVRLYSIPHFSSSYSIAARTPILITPATNPAAPPAK